MITVTPVTDMGSIDSIIRSPEIYAGLTDDSCPKLEDFNMEMARKIEGCLFLGIYDDGALSGWFMFLPKGKEITEVHTVTLPTCRGRKAVSAALQAEEWIFTNTSYQEIVSYSFSDSKPTTLFAILAGLSITGREPHTSTRNGKAVDIIHLSITKDGWKSNHK